MFPKSTELPNKFIAKEKFYGHGDFVGKLKTSMTNDVAKIMATHQFSAKTLNIEAGKTFPEIMVLRVVLKNKDFDIKILDAMDKSIRAAFVLFILEFNGKTSASIAFKDKKADSIAIAKRWTTPWGNDLDLDIEGRSVDSVYENLIGQMSNGKLEKNPDNNLKEKVFSVITDEKVQRQIEHLQKKMDNEPQLKKKLEIKAQIKKLKEQI